MDFSKVNVWILKTSTGGGRIAQRCIEKNVAAVGWSINENSELKERVYDFEDYLNKASYIHDNVNIVKSLVNNININDLIWIRDPNEGLYYIGRRTDKTEWHYSTDIDDYNFDMQNQLTNITWHEVGDESVTPGIISSQFHRAGQTLHRINYGYESAIRYSTSIYNKITNDNFYDCKSIEFNKENFFNLLSPDEVEDLIYFYLYDKYKYIVVPSTNKIGTPNYEFVMLDPNNKNKKIYVQAKNGKVEINCDDYIDLAKYENEFYLFTRGSIIGKKNNNIKIITDDELFEWLQSEDIIVSDAISFWFDYLSKESLGNNRKGIIFDTNQTYYKDDELEMLKHKKIWAKGTPKRYLKSFNKGDYVLYYAKGDGIFAIGEIIDDEPEVIDNGNGLARNVRFICPDEKYLLDKEKQANIYPKDLKHILNKNFYFASTIKSPFLNVEECKKLIGTLKGMYSK